MAELIIEFQLRMSLPYSPIRKESEDTSKPKAQSFVPKTKFSPLSMKKYPQSVAVSLFSYFCSAEYPNVQKIIQYYKTNLCPDKNLCAKGDDCFYYHTHEDRRRPPFVGDVLAYLSQYCPALVSGQACMKGDLCYYAHTRLESSMHPQTYKTVLCPANCQRLYCPFVHSAGEARKLEDLYAYSMRTGEQVSQMMPNISPFAMNPYAVAKEAFGAAEYGKTIVPPALDLDSFKSKPCPFPQQHNQKQCLYFHSASDRRRVHMFYSSDRCPLSKHLHCPREDTCQKSHSTAEQLYHPEKYKKKMCHEYPDRLRECEYGEYCCFAHCEAELNIELIHEYEKDQDFYIFYSKTERCPFNHEHNKSICAYAHNWQDYRRRPRSPYPQYVPTLCPNWDPNKFINEYSEGCPRGLECQYSHGWKECLYHPYSYKTATCPEIGRCHQGPDCPYFHSELDRRYQEREAIPRPRNTSEWARKNCGSHRPDKDRRSSETTGSANMSAGEGEAYTPSELMRENIALPLISSSMESSATKKLGIHRTFGIMDTSPTMYQQETKGDMSNQAKALVQSTDLFPLSEFNSLLKVSTEENQEEEDEDDIEDNGAGAITDDSKEEEKKRHSDSSKDGGGTTDDKSKDDNESDSSESCPSSPVTIAKTYGKVGILTSLHLDNTEEDDEERSKIQLQKLMNSIGLGELAAKLTDKGYGYYDLLVEPEIKCRSVGIVDPAHIGKIAEKIQLILSEPIDAESPGISLKATKNRT